jgi:Flp pilus assembly protein TadD
MGIRHEVITAALVAALVATGCSDRGKSRNAKKAEEKRDVPVATTLTTDAAPIAAPAPPRPVTFADGEAAYQARNYAEASSVFARYTEQRPDNAWGHFMLGLSAWKSGDLEHAEKAFEAALALEPNHVKSLVNLSRVLLDGKRAEDALTTLAKAAELEPDSNEVHRLLGRAYGAQGKTDDAMAEYRRAIEIDGTDSWAMNNLGLLFIEQGRAAEALPLLAKAVELRKDVATFQNNLGMALEHTGHFSDAAAAYRGAVEADANYEKAKLNLARVEKVKESPKEPFDLDAAAKGVVEDAEASPSETTEDQ